MFLFFYDAVIITDLRFKFNLKLIIYLVNWKTNVFDDIKYESSHYFTYLKKWDCYCSKSDTQKNEKNLLVYNYCMYTQNVHTFVLHHNTQNKKLDIMYSRL